MTGVCPFLSFFLWTFDQTGLTLFSFSLSSATDRKRLWQCKVLLSQLSFIGSLRLRGLQLVLARIFSLARPLVILVDSVRAVSFVLLPAKRWDDSWPLFALCHHFIHCVARKRSFQLVFSTPR